MRSDWLQPIDPTQINRKTPQGRRVQVQNAVVALQSSTYEVIPASRAVP